MILKKQWKEMKMKIILNITDKELDIVKGFLMLAEAENISIDDISIDDFKGRTFELKEVDKNIMIAVVLYAIGTELEKGGKE